MNNVNKLIRRDCGYVMWLPLLLHLISEFTQGIVSILTAGILGDFAQAVLNLDTKYAIQHIGELLICIALIVCGIPIIDYVSNYFMLKNSLKHDRILYGLSLRKKYTAFRQIESGEYRFRLEEDPTTYRYLWMQTLTNVIVLVFLLPYTIFVIISINFWLLILLITLSLVRLIIPLLLRNLEAKYDKEDLEYKQMLRNYETDITMAPDIVKLFGLSEHLCSKFSTTFDNYFSATLVKKIPLQIISSNIETILNVASNIIVLIVGAIFVSQGKINVGQMVTVIAYINIFNLLFFKFIFNLRKYPFIRTLLERISFFYKDTEIQQGVQNIESPMWINVNKLCFSYDNKQVIHDLSFTIEQQDKIMLFGSNGSGKSTFVKIFAGLLTDYDGTIIINGIDIRKYDIDYLRKQMSIAMQDPYLFEGTVIDNIISDRSKLDGNKLMDVLKNLGIEHLTNRRVEDLTVPLSGGEKQKIALARTLLSNAALLILDEPTNALDEQSVKWLDFYIRNSKQTILLITHDNRLISCVNKIIRLGSSETASNSITDLKI